MVLNTFLKFSFVLENFSTFCTLGTKYFKHYNKKRQRKNITGVIVIPKIKNC